MFLVVFVCEKERGKHRVEVKTAAALLFLEEGTGFMPNYEEAD